MWPCYLGESVFYARNWPRWREAKLAPVLSMLSGDASVELTRSHEYASYVVEAMELDRPTEIHANATNRGAIQNLPEDGCVEGATRIDGDGVHQCEYGALPEQMAALNGIHIS